MYNLQKLQAAETIIMHKNIKKFAATNNYAKINTKQRYIRHADHCQLVTKGNL